MFALEVAGRELDRARDLGRELEIADRPIRNLEELREIGLRHAKPLAKAAELGSGHDHGWSRSIGLNRYNRRYDGASLFNSKIR